jgi:hypothetical protein
MLIDGFNQTNVTFDLGLYFGYPMCCIKEFINDIRNGRAPSLRTKLAGLNCEGAFHPCTKHTNDILKGYVKIENLIDSRVCPYPFPYRHSISIS